jgi:hypothetical protein
MAEPANNDMVSIGKTPLACIESVQTTIRRLKLHCKWLDGTGYWIGHERHELEQFRSLREVHFITGDFSSMYGVRDDIKG